MVQVVNNFNKEDCRYFKWTFSRGCCGRCDMKSGACGVPLNNEGMELVVPNKVCSLSMRYCKYDPK